MKKIFRCILFVTLFFTFALDVSAEEISSNDIENNSYVIGNYVYTSNTVLSTRHIMLAAKTVNGTDTDDMIIYYKTPRGKWIEGLSGEPISVPDKFDVEYTDDYTYNGTGDINNVTVTCTSSKVENNAYIIGSHIFSSDIVLSTRHIMLAAKTIDGNKIDDMIIYYKTPRGKWIEGLSGNIISSPEAFEISHSNAGELPVINFNGNGGEVDISDKITLKGTVYGELPTPTRKNYIFDGWYTEKEAGTKVESTTEHSSNFDTTVYARWTSIPTLPSYYKSSHFKNIIINNNNVSKNLASITFQDKIDVPDNAIKSWDMSENQEQDVIAYIVRDEYTSWKYDLYIQSDSQLYANEDMSNWFKSFKYLEYIEGLELINTSNVTDMSYMFYESGYSIGTLFFDISNFDTSKVTDMSYMFYEIGSDKSIDVSSFDTSKVTDMSYMFYDASVTGIGSFDTSKVTDMSYMFYSSIINNTMDLSNFDTSNVTNMSHMFSLVDSTVLKLELDNFDTSKVTDMSYMFSYTGYDSDSLTLDLSGFDTSNVTTMSNMFLQTGRYSTTVTIDVSNFDTSNVTDMSSMFDYTGVNSETFTIDVSGFDTSKVTNMSRMFYNIGTDSKNIEIDVSGFDTSEVTDMSLMFAYAGLSNNNFTLDVSGFDTSKVIDMSNMFNCTGATSDNFILDLRNFDTRNVTNMSGMFDGTAWRWSWQNFELYLGENFDTSKVTDMSNMFDSTGLNNVISITIKNPDVSSYSDMFKDVATKTGAQIIVNYTSETSDLVDNMLATKSAGSNVVKGVQID